MTNTDQTFPKDIVGYADNISVRAGDAIQFKISCYSPGKYVADLVRIVCGKSS